MLVRLLYKSRAVRRLRWDEIEILLRRSDAKNQRLGLTGCLLAWNNEFIQVLEGDPTAVNDVYLRIAADERHTDLELMHYSRIEKRMFDNWSMAGFLFDRMEHEQQDFLQLKYSAANDEICIPSEPEEALALIRDLHYFQKAC